MTLVERKQSLLFEIAQIYNVKSLYIEKKDINWNVEKFMQI